MATYTSLLFLSVLVCASAHFGFRRRPMFFPRMPFRHPRFMFGPRFPMMPFPRPMPILPMPMPMPMPIPMPRPMPQPVLHQTIVHQALNEQPIVNPPTTIHHQPIVNQDFSSYHQHKHHHYPRKVVVRPYRDQVGMAGPVGGYTPYDTPLGPMASPGMMPSNPIGLSAAGGLPMDPLNALISVNSGPGMGGMGNGMMGNNMGGGMGGDPFGNNMLGTGANNMGGFADPMGNNMNMLGGNQGMMGGGMDPLANNMGAMGLLSDIMEPQNPGAVNGMGGQGFGNPGMQDLMGPGAGGGGMDFAGLGL